MAYTAPLFRPAFRSLSATPLVTALAILSLALGIGANTALFSIFDSLLLKPLPVRDPAGLAYVQDGSWTYPIWEQVQAHGKDLFDGAFAWSNDRFDLSLGGETEFVDGAYASGETFGVLGVSAIAGRTFDPAEDARGGEPAGPVAVISHRFWQRRFGGAPDVVGRTLTLQRVPFTIVGVLPRGFMGPDVGRASDVFIPFGAEPLIRGKESFLDGRSTWWLEIMVRMKPGQSVAQATAALRGAQPQIRTATLPSDWPAQMQARYMQEALTLTPAATGRSPLRSRLETPLMVMMAAVCLVLLIACANIANLMLARAVGRRRELSVRLALGASRLQLVSLLLAESLMIAGAGAVLGLLFAEWSSALLVRQFATWRDTVFLDLALDWRVLGFTAGLTLMTTLAAGLAPALGAARVSPNETLKDAGRGIAGERRFSLRGALVVLQIALSLVLVVAAGLFLRTFLSLSSAPLGFRPDPLVVAIVNLQKSRVSQDERVALLRRLSEGVAAEPGIRNAAVSVITPVSGSGWNNGVGETNGIPDRSKMTWMNGVSPGWFETYGIRMKAGRDFDAGDRSGNIHVAIVNEAFMGRFLQGKPPVGQTVHSGGPGGGTDYQIVGVVADAIYRSPREGMMPTMYVPMTQLDVVRPSAAMTIEAAPGQQVAAARAAALAMKRIDPDVSFTFRTFDELIGATVTQERLTAILSGFFGGLALLLAGIGLYGVMSHAVSRRRTELGVRMALGADPAGIVRLVFQRAGVLVVAGIVIGGALSFWVSRFIQTLLFHLEARDPATFVGSAGVLAAVAVVAAWVPARRASRLDPASVLREG